MGAMAAEGLVEEMDLRSVIACREGCAACCRYAVRVRSFEAIGIAGYLKSNLRADKWSEVRERIRSMATHYRAVDQETRKDLYIPCPLLENNRCMIYQIRPPICCGHTSLDARDCDPEGVNDKVKINPLLKGKMSDFSRLSDEQIAMGTKAKRGVLEFAIALNAIIDNPLDSVGKWLEGEDVFKDAWVDEEDLLGLKDFGPMKFLERESGGGHHGT